MSQVRSSLRKSLPLVPLLCDTTVMPRIRAIAPPFSSLIFDTTASLKQDEITAAPPDLPENLSEVRYSHTTAARQSRRDDTLGLTRH